jgi:sugar phosphate isomerase/epimerase
MQTTVPSGLIVPGLVSVTFRKLSPQRIVSLITQAGLASVEWGGDVHVPHGDLGRAAAVRRMCADAAVEISAYGSYYRAGDAAQGPDFAAVLETAVELGAPRIRVWAGNAGSVETSAAQRATVMEDLRRICRLAQNAKLEISLEFHGGTLTDQVDSTLRLLAQAAEPNLTTYWQPPERMPTEQCADGLRRLLPRVTDLHVFHWWPDGRHRLPLSAGAGRWKQYFSIAASVPVRRHASLEFVANDDPAGFGQDAKTLINLL